MSQVAVAQPIAPAPNAIVLKAITYFDTRHQRVEIKRGEMIFIDPIERIGCVGRDLFQVECDEYRLLT